MAEDGAINATIANSTIQLIRSTTSTTHHDTTECVFALGYPIVVVVIGGVGILLVSLLGIIGSILTMIVLTRPTMRSTSTNVILMSLAICNLVFVTLNTLFFAMPILLHFFCGWPYYLDIIYPLTFDKLFGLFCLALLGSIYLTVAATIERMVVVYRPYLATHLCTVQNAYRTTFGIVIFVIIFTLPTWWEYVLVDNFDKNGKWLGYAIQFASFRKEPSSNYAFYYARWALIIVYRVIPTAILIVLSILIFKKMRETNELRRTMPPGSYPKENSVTKMILWIVATFIVCNSMRLYVGHRYVYGLEESSLTEAVIGCLLALVNSAVNFVIYWSVGTKFRQTCAQIFCVRKARRPPQQHVQTASESNNSNQVPMMPMPLAPPEEPSF